MKRNLKTLAWFLLAFMIASYLNGLAIMARAS